MLTARAETAARRLSTLRRLEMRNRIVGALRLGLPVAGLLVFLLVSGQLLLRSLGGRFDIGTVSFSGDTVTVDTPAYSGVMANGDIYTVSSRAARTAVTNLNLIELDAPTLVLTRPDGTRLTARAAAGSFETLGQVLTVAGTAEVGNSRGNSGTLEGLAASLPKQTLTATGRARIALAGGMTIDAQGLVYDAVAGRWQFGRTTVTLPQLPGEPAADAENGETP